MARTAEEAFRLFNTWLIPSDSERDKAASHRQTIYDKLDARYGLYRMFQSGSFKHGTGISGHSDVDYFASLKSVRPEHSYSILNSVRDTLQERFPSTYIHVSRPAVVLEFGQGYERVEIIPAYAVGSVGDTDNMKFKIPGVLEEWLESTPEAHLAYVNSSDINVPSGSTKNLTRLVKAWKCYRDVPISSFYLEMRAAAYMRVQKSYIPWLDLYYLLKSLSDSGLVAMNDPTGNTGRIYPCSSDAKHADAVSRLSTALTRAEHAKDYLAGGYISLAFDEWDKLFNGKFPAYS
ncbi:MAG TPA: nucleotidyltransferase [Patescibacteria group bacterium]|jgi:hypothetical protein|nr:nucleotidyltransferase [Patescibacteria group bacterium]